MIGAAPTAANRPISRKEQRGHVGRPLCSSSSSAASCPSLFTSSVSWGQGMSQSWPLLSRKRATSAVAKAPGVLWPPCLLLPSPTVCAGEPGGGRAFRLPPPRTWGPERMGPLLRGHRRQYFMRVFFCRTVRTQSCTLQAASSPATRHPATACNRPRRHNTRRAIRASLRQHRVHVSPCAGNFLPFTVLSLQSK